MTATEHQRKKGGRPRLPRAPELRVPVTASVIEASVAGDSSHCMIAMAVSEAFPGARRVSVDIQTVRFSDPEKGLRYVYITPRVVARAIVLFDAGVLPEAFTFTLKRGQVTRSGKMRDQGVMPASAREKLRDPAVWSKGIAEANPAAVPPAQGRLRNVTGGANVPEIHGGQPPPLARVPVSAPGGAKPGTRVTVPFTRRRQFGLRAFDVPQSPPQPPAPASSASPEGDG